MENEIFGSEYRIRKIGGRLAEDYYTLKKDVDYINIYYFGLFSLLGLTDDIDYIIEALNSHKLYSVFYEKIMRDITEGKTPKENFISKNTKAFLKNLPPEDMEIGKKRELKCMRTKISILFKETGEKYLKENKIYPFCPKHNHTALELCREALYVAETQIAIDIDKFIDIYKDYIEAEESTTHRIHQEAANTINRFFNGVEITEKELSRYFVLAHGVIRVNPKSVNWESYSRLGKRSTRRRKGKQE